MAESIESVFLPAKNSRSSRRPIVIPPWLRSCGEQWSRIPNVETVLLFGSRATGYATPSSDWDVAVLHTGTESPYVPSVAKHDVEIVCLSVDQYCREAHLVGALAYELTLHAMLIAGRDNYWIQKELGLNEAFLKRLLGRTFEKIGTALRYLHAFWGYHNLPQEFENEIAYTSASAASGDGAEYVAKMLCMHLRISYTYTHDVVELSKHVPDAWKGNVLSMNRENTRAARRADHTDFAETCGATLQRVDNSLRLLSKFLQSCIESVSKEDIRAIAHELELIGLATRDLDSLRVAEDVHPRIRSLLKRYDDALEVVLERNRAVNDLQGRGDGL